MAKTGQDGKKKYSTLLLDPRWQRKRLSIFERDTWSCQTCKATTRVLQVHHRWYEHGLLPWEYPDTCFVTLCGVCHKLVSDLRRQPYLAPRRSGPQKTKGITAKDWVRVSQLAWRALAYNRALTLQHWRVLVYLMSYVTYRTSIPLAQRDIAEALEIPVSNVARVLKVLVQHKLVIQTWHGHNAEYSLNTYLVSKGAMPQEEVDHA